MKFSGYSRPGKLVSMISLVVAIGFTIMGIVVLMPQTNWAGLIWTVVFLGLSLYYLMNIILPISIAEEVYVVDASQTDASTRDVQQSIEMRFKQLNELRLNGEITSKEYREQRERVIREI